MAIFKEDEQIKEVNDEREQANDFLRRTPFWSYRSVSYKDYEPLINLLPTLDSHLDKFFQDDIIDDGNSNLLDNLIFDVVRQSIEYLKWQRVNHEDTNKNFVIRKEGDIEAYQRELAKLEEDLKFYNREYDHLMELYWKDEYGEDKNNEK